MTAEWADLNRGEPAGGRLLVATPLLGDPHFARSVVYLLEHNDAGTLGVILNRPSHTPVGQVLPAWHDVVSGPSVVFGGGPVQPDGALCLALAREDAPGVRRVVDGVATIDLDGDIRSIASVADHFRVFAGHAGWSAGQLEDEIDEGAWWVVPGSTEDVFSDAPRPLWQRVLRRQPPPLNLLSTFPEDPSLN
jgi:putative transcriptional regulator